MPESTGEDAELHDILGWVYIRCIIFVAHRLVSLGLDVSEYYDEYLQDIDYKIEDGLKL